MTTDHISDMITKVKNASLARHDSVLISYSKFKASILELLQKEGFIKSVGKKGKKVSKFIEVGLLYDDHRPRITGIVRVSKLSKRIYEKSSNLKPIRQGFGVSVISTPRGVMTDKLARKEKVGGEVLFKIW